MTDVFLVVACHRFVMAGADDDAHLVGQTGVFRVVGIELPVPHSRPKKITLQTQNQLIYPLVETMVAIVGAISILYPLHEARPFVVKENAAPTNSRLAIGVLALTYI